MMPVARTLVTLSALVLVCTALAASSAVSSEDAASAVRVSIVDGGQADASRRFVLRGAHPDDVAAALAAQGAPPLRVHVLDEDGAPAPLPVAGRFLASGDDSGLAFVPSFPLEPGLVYRVSFDRARLKRSRVEHDSVDLASAPATGPRARVTAVYPSPDVLPENLLKFYVHFSAPMMRGYQSEQVRLVDIESGEVVRDGFLLLDEELWDPSGTRLTVFFDPGRIKRGVRPKEEIGTPLREGSRYELRIDAAWPDVSGRPLGAPHRKAFRVGPPDRTPPSPERWKVSRPTPGSRDALVVRTDEPVDRALLERVVTVRNPYDRPLAGTVRIDDAEKRWTFEPAEPWRVGMHFLVVGGTLEDLAGNRPGRPFETEVTDRPGGRIAAPSVRIPLDIE